MSNNTSLVFSRVNLTIALIIIANLISAHVENSKLCLLLIFIITLKGKFPEAEVEFIKAGKPKEAVLM